MAKTLTKKIGDRTYVLEPTIRFKTSYGYAGSKGYEARIKDTGYSLGHYESVSEFVKDRKRALKYK